LGILQLRQENVGYKEKLMNQNINKQANPNIIKDMFQQTGTYSHGLGNLAGLLGQ
jgi:hypothetical protein